MKFLLALALLGGIADAQAPDAGMPWQAKNTADAQAAVVFLNPAKATVAVGTPATLELHFRVADGLHINSHAPHDENLIATQMAVLENAGLRTRSIDFPDGVDTSLPFAPKEKLSVYTGEFVLKVQIVAAAGEHEWQGVLRYQACNLNQCMAPKKLPLSVDVIAK